MGIGMVKKQHPDIRLISRAHGYDIYADYYYKLGFWPCRRIAMSFLERIFPDSQAGTNYLKKNFPEYAAICEPSLQGVSDPGFVNAPSQDHVFRVMSCSMIRTEKRVELLFAGFKRAAEMRPDQKFEWHHIGNGKTRGTLQEKANETLPVNAKAYLPGYTNKETLMRFYRDAPLDVFVNVSATEGTPVSIMEAISCGIPVIATAVGGNVEIVSERNGILLRPDPTPEEIAQALFKIWDNPEKTLRMRKESRKIWAESYNAEVNFRVFAQKLKAIREAE
jgi:glycosyltransferase involved in cell wall biosynthesis